MNHSHRKLARSLAMSMFVLVVAVLWSRREPRFKTPSEMQLQKFFPANTRNVFEKSATWTLFSIEPKAGEESEDAFHGHKILGQTVVRDAETRARLQKALYGAVADSGGSIATCFNPHHGVRATLEKQTVDLILCFSCGTSYFYIGEKQIPTSVAVDSRDTQKVWDRVLENAK